MTAAKKSQNSPRGKPFAAGNPGKPKGATTKSVALIRDMIAQALNNAGGVEYLTERANDPRTASAFLSLVGKAMPVQVTGEGGGALGMTLVITGVPATPQS